MNIFDLPVHPSADLFPMIPDDELNELAADIKANGLLHPIVVKDNVLIDGRNRREACRIAGVDPEYQELNGQDIDNYIIASNINRRHMSKGQRAMAVAMMKPEKDKGGRGKKSLIIKEFNSGYLSQARTVLKHLPDLANNVLLGSASLSSAYETTKEHVERNESEEERLKRLQKTAPEIASRVVDGELELQEAVREHEEKLEQEKVDRMGWWIILRDMDMHTKAFTDESIARLVDAYKSHSDESSVDLSVMISQYKAIIEKLEDAL